MVLTIIYFKRASRGEVAEIFSMLFHTINRPTGSVDVRACFFFAYEIPTFATVPFQSIGTPINPSLSDREEKKRQSIHFPCLARATLFFGALFRWQ